MSRIKTHAEHVADIAKANPNVEVLGEIINARTKVLTRCKICGHEWVVKPNHLKNGKGCPKCASKKRGRKTHDQHVEEIAAVNPGVEVIGRITRVTDKVLTRCRTCGHTWEAVPKSLKRGEGCPKCAGNTRKTHAEHVAEIAAKNPNVKIIGQITGVKNKVLTRCRVCGHIWQARPCNLKEGAGCPECARRARAKSHKQHIAEIAKVNPGVKVLGKITHNKKEVLTRCRKCGYEWMITPNRLKNGRGCPRCAKYGFLRYDVGKLYIMVDDLEAPTMIKIGVSINEKDRSKQVLKSAHKAGVSIPALYVAKTWEGPTELMTRIEQMMHENYEEWNIKFPAKFNGCTEFFYYTHETAEVFEVIEETLHEIINGNKAA